MKKNGQGIRKCNLIFVVVVFLSKPNSFYFFFTWIPVIYYWNFIIPRLFLESKTNLMGIGREIKLLIYHGPNEDAMLLLLN